MPVSRNAMRSQNGRSSRPTVSVPPSGIARRALSHKFQKTCLILLAIDARAQFAPLNDRAIWYLVPISGFLLDERQRFVQQRARHPLPEIRRSSRANSSGNR